VLFTEHLTNGATSTVNYQLNQAWQVSCKFLFKVAQEHETRAETNVLYSKQQHIIARKKCSVLNKEFSFTVLLQNTCNKKKSPKSLKNIPPQQCHVHKKFRVKGKGHPRTDHGGPDGERGIALPFL
jgi:hypothetical protein